MDWFLTPEALKEIQELHARGLVLSAEQMTEFNALYSDDFPGSRIFQKVGTVAQVNIAGVLTKEPNWMYRYYGGGNTAYSEIISAINEAERDPAIKEIILAIDSPGGQTNGLCAAMDAIKNTKKTVLAIVEGQAASAAYGLASQAGKIIAADRGCMVGSVGVASSLVVNENVVDIASTNAPKKRPDVTTDAGKAVIRETLDQIESIFIADIAAGRKVTADKVKLEFGQGGMYVAAHALERGMIDEIKSSDSTQTTSAKSPITYTSKGENSQMDAATLKAQFPAVYNAIYNEGKTAENERVTAHLTLGEASGDMQTAISAINDGSELTASIQAKYMAANMKRGQVAGRENDDTAAANALNGIKPGAVEPDANAVANMVAKNLGVAVA